MEENLKRLNSHLINSDNILLVVSHPDDEFFFFYPLIEQFAKKLTVVCVTKGNFEGNDCGEHRIKNMKEFLIEMNVKKFECLDFNDSPFNTFAEKEFFDKLSQKVDLNSFRTVFTHNAHGEYGHLNHISTSRNVHALFYQKATVYSPADYVPADFDLEVLDHHRMFKYLKKFYAKEYSEFWKYKSLLNHFNYSCLELNEVIEVTTSLLDSAEIDKEKLDKYKYIIDYIIS